MDGPRPQIPEIPRAEAAVEIVRGVFAVPGHHCLFDGSGERINRSVGRTAGRWHRPAPNRFVVPTAPTTIEQPVVFARLLPKAHFGQALLEMFTRL